MRDRCGGRVGPWRSSPSTPVTSPILPEWEQFRTGPAPANSSQVGCTVADRRLSAQRAGSRPTTPPSRRRLRMFDSVKDASAKAHAARSERRTRTEDTHAGRQAPSAGGAQPRTRTAVTLFGPPLFPRRPGPARSLLRSLALRSARTWNSQGDGASGCVLCLPSRCSSSQLTSSYLDPSTSPTFPSPPSLGGVEGVCPTLKTSVEVRMEGGEEHHVAALFRGQIHFFTRSLNNLLVPAMCLAHLVQRQRGNRQKK